MEIDKQLNNIIKEEWRKLGFYYEVDHEKKTWIFVGSKSGLEDLCVIFDDYTMDIKYNKIGEHIHIDPYNYLKIMTSAKFKVTADYICGTIEDLKKLSLLLKAEIKNAAIGISKTINNEFFRGCDYLIELRIMDYGYDPATADIQLWK